MEKGERSEQKTEKFAFPLENKFLFCQKIG